MGIDEIALSIDGRPLDPKDSVDIQVSRIIESGRMFIDPILAEPPVVDGLAGAPDCLFAVEALNSFPATAFYTSGSPLSVAASTYLNAGLIQQSIVRPI